MKYRRTFVNYLLNMQRFMQHTENVQKPIQLHRNKLIITVGLEVRLSNC
jgi:hypothetical protein